MKTQPKRLFPNRSLLALILACLGLAASSSTSLGISIQPAVTAAAQGLDDWLGSGVAAGISGSGLAASAALETAPQRWAGPDPRAYVRQLPFGPEIERVARRHRLDALLLASVVEAESSFQPDAISPKGAVGLMQLMPFHLADGAIPVDPRANLELGASYLALLKQRFHGDLALTLAAYHAGPGAVDRFGGVPPYPSTREYVARVLSLYSEHLEQLVDTGSRTATVAAERQDEAGGRRS